MLALSKVAKLPQVVQQQTPVASIQQVASASQQVGCADLGAGGATICERFSSFRSRMLVI